MTSCIGANAEGAWPATKGDGKGGRAVTTQEVADATLFLLSSRAAGINAQRIVLDAGMSVNHFDREIVKKSTWPE